MFDVGIECSADYSDDSSNGMIKKIPVKDEINAAENAKPCEDNKHNSG